MDETTNKIARAVDVLRRGGLVAFPTETVYGLGANAENVAAVRRVFFVKGRPASHPLIVHLSDARDLDRWALDIPDAARRLAHEFWPGPLTIILRRSSRVPDAVTGGLDTVGLRVPSHPVALALLRSFGGGVAAPSANRFGRVSPTTAEHVRQDLGDDVDFILDGGPCSVGIESAIVDASRGDVAILRPGGVTREQLETVLGQSVPMRRDGEVRSPGQHPVHYAPEAELILVERDELIARAAALKAAGHRVVVLAHDDDPIPGELERITLPRSNAELARVLYETLRRLDAEKFDVALVVLPDDAGLGSAIRDRLRRAAGSPSDAQQHG